MGTLLDFWHIEPSAGAASRSVLRK